MEEKITVHYHLLDNSIVLNYLGKTVVVSGDDKERFDGVILCIKEGRLDDIPAVVEIERGFEGSGFELKDGLLHADGQPIPSELNAHIMHYKELGLPYESLLRFWDNLKLNPSFNARKMLFAFLEHNGHPFTDDGCFIAYRGVTTDFKDVHTRTFDNSVGSICEMDRDLVDDNPNNTCSNGLHVACFSYASTFGDRLVEVKVNPRDVVAVPTDYNGTKMRTCKFEVVALGKEIRNEVLYGRADSVPQPETEEIEAEEVEEVDEDACKNCGKEDVNFYNFCPECGEPTDS